VDFASPLSQRVGGPLPNRAIGRVRTYVSKPIFGCNFHAFEQAEVTHTYFNTYQAKVYSSICNSYSNQLSERNEQIKG